LAVSDTQAIRDDAEIVSYIARAKLLFQSSSLPFLGTLKRKCCCWKKGSNCLKSIKNRVCLSPNQIPENKIRVLPNQGSRIIFTNRQEEEGRSRYFLDGCRACILGSGILERAMEIINNCGKISEMEDVKTLLNLSQKKLEEYERRFNSIENSWKESEVKLEGILNTFLQFNPPTTVSTNE
jgi:hypothetical protein